MKPIENIFGFDCSTCEHNRHCYGGNIGNQFRYCQKSTEKIQNLDNLEKQNKQLKDNWNELKKWLEENESFDDYCNETTFTSVLDKIQELEQGIDSNESK